MNGTDLALLAVLLLSTLVGVWRGFHGEVMSLASWILAIAFALWFGDDAAALFRGVEPVQARLVLGYAVVFIGTFVLCGIAAWLIGRLLKASGLDGVDRLLGGGFGLLRGVLVGCVLVLMLQFTPATEHAWWRDSRLLPAFSVAAHWLRAQIPAQVVQELQIQHVAPPRPSET
jgi:membrane protein required for colicin V production